MAALPRRAGWDILVCLTLRFSCRQQHHLWCPVLGNVFQHSRIVADRNVALSEYLCSLPRQWHSGLTLAETELAAFREIPGVGSPPDSGAGLPGAPTSPAPYSSTLSAAVPSPLIPRIRTFLRPRLTTVLSPIPQIAT
ncbi:hypothetical protein B0T18DRAFT_59479 [Schizothecium vesticola]|uniref:Uncharacterized protein n=1 Tax=Schizothecium vesticola TaxID=314040 RepID=A0AA40F477_9PEZI|nr:hypothetical protein B0T18DRAFT_59479 [Schizothecium vesticola]